jgi:NAD(P)H-hydrate repair Nnr-like enzyme with NAD(P)H-hydrate dehydratase domain
LRLLDLDRLSGRAKPVVLTPHAGEFTALFGALAGSAIDRSRAASQRIGGHVVVLKGATTVIARAGRTIVSPGGSGWLSTAGTGDVLAGAIAAMLARGGSAADGVWLHAEAARRAGPAFIADDLAYALSAARGSL